MLSQLMKISRQADGRYASDEELQFMVDYIRSYNLRVQTYQTLQASETAIVQEVHSKLQALDPTLLRSSTGDISTKWKLDTVRVLRYSALALLLNDPDTLRERLLFWMQTIMKAFGAQKSCNATYTVMQEVIRQHLTPEQANVFCPILEVNRRMLGDV